MDHDYAVSYYEIICGKKLNSNDNYYLLYRYVFL